MKPERLVDEEVIIRLIKRELKLNTEQACAWLEKAVRTGLITPEGDFTEADRPHWKCWKNLN